MCTILPSIHRVKTAGLWCGWHESTTVVSKDDEITSPITTVVVQQNSTHRVVRQQSLRWWGTSYLELSLPTCTYVALAIYDGRERTQGGFANATAMPLHRQTEVHGLVHRAQLLLGSKRRRIAHYDNKLTRGTMKQPDPAHLQPTTRQKCIELYDYL